MPLGECETASDGACSARYGIQTVRNVPRRAVRPKVRCRLETADLNSPVQRPAERQRKERTKTNALAYLDSITLWSPLGVRLRTSPMLTSLTEPLSKMSVRARRLPFTGRKRTAKLKLSRGPQPILRSRREPETKSGLPTTAVTSATDRPKTSCPSNSPLVRSIRWPPAANTAAGTQNAATTTTRARIQVFGYDGSLSAECRCRPLNSVVLDLAV